MAVALTEAGRILLLQHRAAEIDARLRLVVGRRGDLADQESLGKVSPGRAGDRRRHLHRPAAWPPLDLTYKVPSC